MPWLPPLLIGLSFATLGGIKLYGLFRGYEGGPGRSSWERLRAGSCAGEHCRVGSRWRMPLYLANVIVMLGVGIYGLWRFAIVVAGS